VSIFTKNFEWISVVNERQLMVKVAIRTDVHCFVSIMTG